MFTLSATIKTYAQVSILTLSKMHYCIAEYTHNMRRAMSVLRDGGSKAEARNALNKAWRRLFVRSANLGRIFYLAIENLRNQIECFIKSQKFTVGFYV